jgi:hypothetical protein
LQAKIFQMHGYIMKDTQRQKASNHAG